MRETTADVRRDIELTRELQFASSSQSSPIHEARIDRHESDTPSGDAAAPMQDSRAD